MKEKKARVDDALSATRAAIEEGIVPGGGVAIVRAAEKLNKLKGENDDEQTGINIITRSAEEPLRQIVENTGLEGRLGGFFTDIKIGVTTLEELDTF